MRLFGHPVHPMLVAFPVALLVLAPVWDGLAVLGVLADARTAGYFCTLAGLVTGGLAAIAGFVDLVKIPSSKPAAVRVALAHASCALVAVSLCGTGFAFRGGVAAMPGAGVLGLEIAGALVLVATGWLGGHLVFRHGIGVELVDGEHSVGERPSQKSEVRSP
jgi:uncharacterized membrane protein